MASPPVRLTSFIGRTAEIAEVVGLLGRSRMVTLTGSGGCGKTRLAQQISRHVEGSVPDAVWWVDLGRVADPSVTPSAVADALSVREVPGRPIVDVVAAEIGDRRALLILDNCEHVVEACASLADTLLRSCRELSVLATSRRPLEVEGEVAFRVPSMELPPEDAADPRSVARSESGTLFLDRAAMVSPGFRLTAGAAPAVAEICRRLDGMPLAIELAAARVRLLSPERIARELGDALRLLVGGARSAVPRHRTLEASIEWSHGLLSEGERALLRRLSVFAGGFGLEAAEAVGSSEGIERSEVLQLLGGLVDHSLVQVEEREPEPRYRLLETIRQYAARKLEEAGEVDAAWARHLEVYVSLAERLEVDLESAGMVEAIRLLRREYGNLRAAMDRGAAGGRPGPALRVAAALRVLWFAEGPWSEMRDRFQSLLAADIPDLTVRARGLVGASSVCFQLFDWPAAGGFAEEALALGRKLGDRATVARSLSLLGTARMWMGDLPAARPLLEEAVAAGGETGDLFTVSQAHWALANGELLHEGHLSRARGAFERSIAAGRKSGNPLRLGMALAMAGNVTGWSDLRRSEGLLREAVSHLSDLGEAPFRAAALAGLGWIRVCRGDGPGAHALAAEGVDLAMRAGHPGSLSYARFVAGWVRRHDGEMDAAAAELRESVRLGRIADIPGWTCVYAAGLARVQIERGDLEGADATLEEAAALLADPPGIFRGLLADASARAARARGRVDEAEARAHEALRALAGEMTPWVIELLELVAWTAAGQESGVEAMRLFGAAEAARTATGYVRPAEQALRWEADLALARSLLGRGEAEQALQEGRGMSLDDSVAYAGRGRGERRRPSHGWASLTPTELEVAELVAERLTNPQIAERLFVSRSTVKAHLSHIYAKLGISSRLDLADEVTRRGE